MNIYFIYDKNEVEFEDKVCELKEYIKENQNTYKVKVLSKLTNKANCDVYIVISNQIDEIYKYIEKYKIKENALIITSNLTASHILACIDITSNVTHLGNNCDVILKRINNIYEKTKDKK